jgi:signal transduction histidine kinase
MAGFSMAYRAALRGYLEGSGESGLTRAWELGRRALRERLGLLEVAALHVQLVGDGIARGPHPAVPRLAAEGAFLLEVLASFEMAQRGFDEATEVLRQLNQRLENELRRIAHSLHDEVQQLLVAVYIGLEEIRDELPAEKAEPLSGILRQVDGIAEHVRTIAHELRPTILDHVGLMAALQLLADGVSRRHGLQVSIAGSVGRRRLEPRVELAFYRIAQEGLTNVVRHARARHAVIRLHRTPSGCCSRCVTTAPASTLPR